MSIGNITLTETRKQAFLLAPPSKPRKQKDPEDCYLSFIDQGTDGYGGSKLVRNEPRTHRDIYFTVRTRTTSVLSYRRNISHISVVSYRTKKDGATRANIAYMNCSFLELDGANDGTVKTKEDVYTLINKNNLPMPSYVIPTSKGHFHVIWTYDDPLPWTTKGESFWISQQKKLIKLFRRAGFNVDKGASLNPTQNLRNPSQLKPYNFKRRCEVYIYKSYQKTSLRRIYKALNGTNIPNPRRLQASVKLRRFSRANKTFITTNAELAETLGTCTKTAQREVSKAIANGDLQIVRRIGNNHGTKRATEYLSNLYIESNSQKGHLSISKNNALKKTDLLTDFQGNGAENGRRNRTLFVLAVGLSCKSNQTLGVSEIADQLRGGSLRSGLSEKELVRTIKNAVKPAYNNPFSLAKMREWNLVVGPKHFH